MMRKIAMMCAMMVMVSTASFAAPVVSSLDGLSAYGTWIAQGSNGRVTKTGTLTSADFTLAEGFTAQYYVSENKTIAKTGGERKVPAGAIASVYDERSMVDDNKKSPEIKEFKAEVLATSADVVKTFGGKVGNNGEVIAPLPAYTKITVNKTWDSVSTWGGKKTAGQSYTSGAVDETATWWPAAEEAAPEEPKEITEIAADQLVTADDVISVFGNGKKGANGEVEVEIPAYTRVWVYDSWGTVSLWDGTTVAAGDSFETAGSAMKVTFWPDYDYWTAQNTVTVAPADLEKYFEIGEPVVEGSVWQTVVAKAEMAGKTLSLDMSLTAVTIKGDGVVLETPVITVPAADAKTAADAADVIRICKKADLERADYATLSGIRKASPVNVEVENRGEGSNAVKFYVALSTWSPKLGGNFYDLSVDPTHVDVKDSVYTSKDGYHIQYVTAWLHNVVDATRKAADTGNGGGSGGGGCDAGFGAVAFVLLPLLYLKKGRK